MSNVILSTSVTRSQLPDQWKVAPIESVCLRVTSGGTPSRKEPSFYNGGTILWAKSSELKDWYVHDTSEKITQEGLDSSSAKMLPKDTVLLALYGDGRTITSLGLLAQPAACNQACCAMICNPAECHPHFLLYSLKHHRTELIGLASGASQRNLSGKLLKQFPIAVPSLSTQQKIASILSAYDDLIENNTRRIAILEEMAQAVYREWFVNFKFPGHENAKFVESELGKIPEGWKASSLGETSENFDRIRKPLSGRQREGRKGPYRYYGASGVIDALDDYLFDGKYLLIAEDGENINSRKLPIAFLAYGKFWVNNHAHVLQGKGDVSSEFLMVAVSQTDVKPYVTGAAQPKINQANLNRIPIVVATETIQKRFNESVVPMFDERLLLLRKNDNLRATRDLLLPKLISGQLNVEDLDIDTGVEDEVLEALA